MEHAAPGYSFLSFSLNRACKGTKIFWNMQKKCIFFCNFNKKTSTAVPLWNERYEEFLKCANIKNKIFKIIQNYFFFVYCLLVANIIRVMVEQYELARYK